MKFIKNKLKNHNKKIFASLARFIPKGYIFNTGFTLIETLVSLALFSVVLVISGGTIASVIDVNKRNQAISSVVNNLNYSIDSMIRDIKTGYLYKCRYDDTDSNANRLTLKGLKIDNDESLKECKNEKSLTLVSTISGKPVVVRYKFTEPVDGNGFIEKTIYKDNGQIDGRYSITDKNNVKIDSVNFTVKNPSALNCDGNDCKYGQPSVFVVIKGKAGNQTIEVSKFYVQTFISQRLINITDFKDEI